MREFVDPSTGEVFALVSLADWQRIMIVAHRVDTDNAGSCHCTACTLASMILVAGGRASTLDRWNVAHWHNIGVMPPQARCQHTTSAGEQCELPLDHLGSHQLA